MFAKLNGQSVLAGQTRGLVSKETDAALVQT